MDWLDYYLRAEDEAEFTDAIPAAWTDAAEAAEINAQIAISVIGELKENTGWHVNLRLSPGVELPSTLAALCIATPAYPKRIFL